MLFAVHTQRIQRGIREIEYIMKKKLSSKVALHRLSLGADRAVQKEQGFFDGRFVQRVEPSAKKYSRKQKHNTKKFDDL